ncbi:MAG: metal-dependent hydrolase [Clostridia bacterium]|nr:metal-dependent hydrolase [Clostridia bacterium]MCI9080669.1 metal-dependent hydrolase [Lachnospiraceae bacterium]
MSNIQITEKLFIELVKYHLLEIDDERLSEEIKAELNNKLTKLINRDLYSKYLQCDIEIDRKKALEEYIKYKNSIVL